LAGAVGVASLELWASSNLLFGGGALGLELSDWSCRIGAVNVGGSYLCWSCRCFIGAVAVGAVLSPLEPLPFSYLHFVVGAVGVELSWLKLSALRVSSADGAVALAVVVVAVAVGVVIEA
jgi:hypothetical protein